ncbi:MAG: hypothetical protein KDI88_05710, partial [Gammaproteobacteria bacterium]|nr:hypothetical protein [Gammaproteobacteria bacterium]
IGGAPALGLMRASEQGRPMKAFATWVMKGRMQAIIAATVLSLLALLVTPLALLSAAVVMLAVLRQGWREGAVVVGGALSAMAGLGFLLLGMPLAAVLVGAMMLIPAAVLGGVLGLTGSLRRAIEVAGLGAVLIVVAQHLLMTDPTAFWAEVLNTFLASNVDSEALAEADLSQLVEVMSGWMAGGLAATWLIGSVISLALARRWSDLIDEKSEAAAAFHELRFGRGLLILVPLLLLFVVIDGGRPSLIGHLYLVGMVLYLVQGVAVAHGLVAMFGASPAWLVGLYMLLVFVAPHGATMVAVAGYADGWVDFRARARARRRDTDGV